MIGKKKRAVTEPRLGVPRPARPRIPVALAIRMFLLGGVAVLACVWAVWRHYMVARPQLLVPVPPPASGEIEIEPP